MNPIATGLVPKVVCMVLVALALSMSVLLVVSVSIPSLVAAQPSTSRALTAQESAADPCPEGMRLTVDEQNCFEEPVVEEVPYSFCDVGQPMGDEAMGELAQCFVYANLNPRADSAARSAVCPPFASLAKLSNGVGCARSEATVLSDPACPEGTTHVENGSCFVLISGRRTRTVCETGELAGNTCVVSDDQTTTTESGELICSHGFEIHRNRCVRFAPGVRIDLGCPEGAVELDTNCALKLPHAPRSHTCADELATLVGEKYCLVAVPSTQALTPDLLSCPEGELVIAEVTQSGTETGICVSPASTGITTTSVCRRGVAASDESSCLLPRLDRVDPPPAMDPAFTG